MTCFGRSLKTGTEPVPDSQCVMFQYTQFKKSIKSPSSNIRSLGLTRELYVERDTLENGEIGRSIILLVLGTHPFILSFRVL